MIFWECIDKMKNTDKMEMMFRDMVEYLSILHTELRNKYSGKEGVVIEDTFKNISLLVERKYSDFSLMNEKLKIKGKK